MSGREAQRVELPRDPDLDDVPEELRDRDDGELIVVDEDGGPPAMVVVLPEAWARARRIREDQEHA